MLLYWLIDGFGEKHTIDEMAELKHGTHIEMVELNDEKYSIHDIVLAELSCFLGY